MLILNRGDKPINQSTHQPYCDYLFLTKKQMKRSIKYLVGVLLLFVQICFVNAQDTDWKKLIESWRMDYNIPGMSVGIIRNGEVVFVDGFGELEEGKAQKADKSTLYSVASNTKAFISASIATLVSEGKMKWDDRVQKYLPYFELYDP